MFVVLGIMVCGMVAGRLLRSRGFAQRLGGPVLWTVVALLFLMGAAVGANERLLSALPSIGRDAALIAGASVAGSVLLGALVWRLCLRRGAETPRRVQPGNGPGSPNPGRAPESETGSAEPEPARAPESGNPSRNRARAFGAPETRA